MTLTPELQLVLFKPEGRVDLEGGRVLSEQMSEIVPRSQQLWVIDLVKVDFMDSSGLVALVKGLRSAHQSGCRLVLCNVQAPVRLILELTHLDSVFEIFNSYEDILTTLNNKAVTG